jgi:SAM-dependent methyltransferase
MPLNAHVLDRCATPLALCEHYATAVGTTVATHHTPMNAFTTDTPFDLIFVHTVLGYIPALERAALFAHWYQLLRPGGKLVLRQRLRPDAAQGIARFADAQGVHLLNAVKTAIETRYAPLGIAPQTLLHWVSLYVQRFQSYPVHSGTELEALCQQAKLQVVDCVTFSTAPEPGQHADGPTMSPGAQFLVLTAQRAYE